MFEFILSWWNVIFPFLIISGCAAAVLFVSTWIDQRSDSPLSREASKRMYFAGAVALVIFLCLGSLILRFTSQYRERIEALIQTKDLLSAAVLAEKADDLRGMKRIGDCLLEAGYPQEAAHLLLKSHALTNAELMERGHNIRDNAKAMQYFIYIAKDDSTLQEVVESLGSAELNVSTHGRTLAKLSADAALSRNIGIQGRCEKLATLARQLKLQKQDDLAEVVAFQAETEMRIHAAAVLAEKKRSEESFP